MTVLAYAPLVLQLLLLWQLARAKAHTVFPCFFAYTLFSVLATTLRFAVRNHTAAYFYVYWITDAAYSVLGVVVLYEVCRGVFRNLGRSLWARAVFPTVVAISIVLTLSRIQAPLAGAHPVLAFVIATELGVRFLQVLMFVMLVVLVALFGQRWRQHPFGISAGYGIYASVNLFTTTKYYESGTSFTFLWGRVSVITYTIAVLVWLWYFSTPVKAEAPSSEQPPLSLQALERYKEIARRVPRP